MGVVENVYTGVLDVPTPALNALASMVLSVSAPPPGFAVAPPAAFQADSVTALDNAIALA